MYKLFSEIYVISIQLLDAKLLNIPFPSWFLLQGIHLHFRKKIFQTANNIVNQNSETDDDDNDTTADLGHFEVADELEDDEITSDDEHSIGSDNEHGTLYNQNEHESAVDGDDENSTSDEDEQHNDDTLNQSQRIRYSVRQLVKRIRACVTDVRNTRVINDYVRKRPNQMSHLLKQTSLLILKSDGTLHSLWLIGSLLIARLSMKSIADHINLHA